MRTILMATAVALALLLPGARPAVATISTPLAVSESRPIAPGVLHHRGSVTSAAGPAAVNIVALQELTDSVFLETTLAQDRVNAREQPTLQALRHSVDGHRVVATINGSNFSAPAGLPFHPNGLLVTKGELASAGHKRAADELVAFGIDTAGRAFSGAPRLSVTATLPDGSTAVINRVNQRLMPDGAILYSPRYDTSTRTAAPTIEFVVSGVALPLRTSGSYAGTVSELRMGAGDSPLAEGSLVVAADGSAAAPFMTLQVGDPITIDLAIDEPWHDLSLAVGGREILLRNGVIDIFPTNGTKMRTPEPRSAIGVTASGELLLVAVDGRQAHSRGVTVQEMAELMRDLGAVEAINLDGGGSTVLKARTPGNIEATTVNSPSGGIERSVSNAIHVVSAIPAGPLTQVVVLPARPSVKEGETRQLQLAGYDSAYNAVPPAEPVSWTLTGGAASIDASGLLTGLTPGIVTAHASAGEWSASTEIQVTPDLGVLSVSPPEPSFITQISATKTGVQLAVAWQAINPKAAVTRIELQAKVNNGRWKAIVLPQPAPGGVSRWFRFGRLHQLRIRATDAAGNRSAWVLGTPFRLLTYNVTNPALERQGSWTNVRSRHAIGGWLARTSEAGARLNLVATGDQVAIVGQRGRKGGIAGVGYLDDAITNVPLHSTAARRRVLLWTGQGSESGEGFDGVTVVNSSSGPLWRVEIDAVIVLRLGG